MIEAAIDLDRLLKPRLVVARFGEMDLARWWNTKDQIGRLGASALRRGFPRTHRFAQPRSVLAVAAHRCAEVFDPPGCVALDRSLAIAHGLEDVFWVEGTDGKWTAREAPTRSVDELVREPTSPAVKAALESLLEAPIAVGAVKKTRKVKSNA